MRLEHIDSTQRLKSQEDTEATDETVRVACNADEFVTDAAALEDL